MSNRYIIDIRKDQGNNAEVSITLYSPLLIISSRPLESKEIDALNECDIDYELKVSNKTSEDIFFIETLANTNLKPVCVNTGRVLSFEVNILGYTGKVFGLQARKKLAALRDNISSSSLSPTLKYSLNQFLVFLDNLSECDERFISKDCFFNTPEVWGRKEESYLEMLNLIEIDKLQSFYNDNIFNSYLCSNSLKSRKAACLNDFSGLKNDGEMDLKKTDDFPTALKLLSVFYIKAAEFKLSASVLSSAFMFAFRALEVYCDGLLVYYDKAYIGNALNRQGHIYKENTLLVNNRFVSGFGSKWNEIKNHEELNNIDPTVISDLDDMKELRNNFLLTHGNVRITRSIAQEAINTVSAFISSFENEINQQTTRWSNISERAEDLLFFDIVDEIGSFCAEGL